MDMSPYVRKTAANAIPKLYRYSIFAALVYTCSIVYVLVQYMYPYYLFAFWFHSYMYILA